MTLMSLTGTYSLAIPPKNESLLIKSDQSEHWVCVWSEGLWWGSSVYIVSKWKLTSGPSFMSINTVLVKQTYGNTLKRDIFPNASPQTKDIITAFCGDEAENTSSQKTRSRQRETNIRWSVESPPSSSSHRLFNSHFSPHERKIRPRKLMLILRTINKAKARE